jgi:hypothetical protein
VIPQVRETGRTNSYPAILRVPRASLDVLGETKIRIEACGATGDRSAGALQTCAGRDRALFRRGLVAATVAGVWE